MNIVVADEFSQNKTHAFMDTNTDQPKFVIYRTVKRFKLLNC